MDQDPYYENLGLKLSELIKTASEVSNSESVENPPLFYNLIKKVYECSSNEDCDCAAKDVQKIKNLYLVDLAKAVSDIKAMGYIKVEENKLLKDIEILRKRFVTRTTNELIKISKKKTRQDLASFLQ